MAIYPSLLSADPLRLAEEIETLDPYCVGYHLDVMDHHFVPNLAFSPAVVNAVARRTKRTLWVHLMVDCPEVVSDHLILPPSSMVSFHFESTPSDFAMIKKLREKKLRPGIAVSPKTPVQDIFRFLNLDIDHVLIMSVEPGFSGQDFLPEVTAKIGPLIAYRSSADLNFRIAMDGGINAQNIGALHSKGVDDFAVANAIFGASNPVQALKQLQELAGGGA